MNDPRDWALDIQIILDLLLSKRGVVGTYSDKNGIKSSGNSGWQNDGQPPIFFSNPDMLWAAEYSLPRLGQGAFAAALAGIWMGITNGVKLKAYHHGKPFQQTYEYAEKVLNTYRDQTLEMDGASSEVLKSVYMVGDNPESDIRGANYFKSSTGASWKSVLVETGVFQKGTTPAYEPNQIVPDVKAAVNWALAQENWDGRIE